MESNLRIDRDGDILVLTIDVPGKPVNTLTRSLWSDLDEAIEQIESSSATGLIIASAKSNSFIAGADLKELSAMSAIELREYLRRGQEILNRLEQLPIPTVAAINGHALGGGLEVALACKHRVAAGAGKFIGLPETTLGLIPGWGGTQRLPRLIGLTPALELLVSGKSVSVDEARTLGIVDDAGLLDDLLAMAKRGLANTPRQPVFPDERDEAVFERYLSEARRGAGVHLPAPTRAITVARIGWEQGIAAGLGAEIDGLVELRDGVVGRHLLRNFFLRTSAKSLAGKGLPGTAREIDRAAVIGGGTMGSGIAHSIARSGKPVTLIEIDPAAAAAAQSRVFKLLADDLNASRLSPDQHQQATQRIRVSSSLDDARDADIVIEAIVEQLDAKRKLFNRLDSIVRPDAVLASNTSSLSIAAMAESTSDPSRFVGVHFFNPVARLALVEVVSQPQTDADTLQTALAFARKVAGKTPVLANDGPGFIVNRVLMPYLSEALRLVDEGTDIESIDSALTGWGMPMGPIALIDTIGLDVTSMIFDALRPHLGERVYPESAAMRSLMNTAAMGRKAGKGFFVYPKERGAPPTLYPEMARANGRASSTDDIILRTITMMSAEAVRVLEEKVAADVETIDIATLLGMGFPAFRGGLGSYVRDIGIDALLITLNALRNRFGERFAPPASVEKLSGTGQTLDALAVSRSASES